MSDDRVGGCVHGFEAELEGLGRGDVDFHTWSREGEGVKGRVRV